MNILIITHALNGLLMIAMPVGLAIFLARRWKLGWRVWWIGFATFVFSQVGHIPFNSAVSLLLNRTEMVFWSPTAQMLFNATFLGLSAGLFEEGARYLVLRFWATDARSWRTGVQFGAGHGGAEAIIFGALAVYTYVYLMTIRNVDLSTIVQPAQLELAQQQVAAYWSVPWVLSLFGALERLLTIPVQICLAVIVMQTFIRKQWFWVWLAVLFHAVVDTTAVLASQYVGTYWTEAFLVVFSILSIFIIFRLRQPEPVPDIAPVPLAPVPAVPAKPVEETDENLDKTRYQ
jgi:uncharacterized membrane protein YhfC